MKMLKFVLLAIFLPITLLPAGGFTPVPPEGMPDRLPLGSREETIDWVITNRVCQNFVRVTFKDVDGNEFKVSANSPFTQNKTQKEFWDWVADNGMRLIDDVKNKGNPDPEYNIFIEYNIRRSPVDVNGYPDFKGQDPVPLEGKKFLGKIGSVTRNDLTKLDVKFYTMDMQILGLESMKLYVDDSFAYSWQVGVGGQGYLNSVLETTTGIPYLLVYNYWLSGDFRLRLTLTVSGESKTFTQYGDSLVSQDSISISKEGIVSITSFVPKGSILTLQSSPDLHTWTDYMYCGEQSGNIFNAEFSMDHGAKSVFYRTYVR